MKHFNPYADIEKVPLFTEGMEMQSKMYAVKMDVPKEIETERGKITTMQPHECGTVSESFMLIPNSDVAMFASDLVGSLDGQWDTHKTVFDGSKYMMTQLCTSDFASAELEVGDTVNLGIMWRNAYDMSTSLSMQMFLSVLSCLNGMQNRVWFPRMRFKHTPNNHNWKEVLSQTKETIAHAANSMPEMAENLNKLHRTKISTTNELGVLRGHIGQDILGYTQFGKVVDRFLTEEPASGGTHTLWDFTQACTHTFWNGNKDDTRINSWADLDTNEKCIRKLTAIGNVVSEA